MQYKNGIEIFGSEVMVAASNATYREKMYARMSGGSVCDGTDDDVQINAALAANTRVILSSGHFSGGQITKTADNVWLDGQGIGITTYTLKNAANNNGIFPVGINWKLTNFTYNGNCTNQTPLFGSGIGGYSCRPHGLYIDNVRIESAVLDGLRLVLTNGFYVGYLETYRNSWCGVSIEGSTDGTIDFLHSIEDGFWNCDNSLSINDDEGTATASDNINIGTVICEDPAYCGWVIGEGFTTGSTACTNITIDKTYVFGSNIAGGTARMHGCKHVKIGSVITSGSNPFQACWRWNGASYDNDTVEAASPVGTPFDFLSTSSQYFYFGRSKPFAQAAFELDTFGSYGAQSWQYWNGATWSSLNVTTPYNFTTDSPNHETPKWGVPTNWAALAFSAVSPHAAAPPDTTARYWVRLSVASVTTKAIVERIGLDPCDAFAIENSSSDIHVGSLMCINSDSTLYIGENSIYTGTVPSDVVIDYMYSYNSTKASGGSIAQILGGTDIHIGKMILVDDRGAAGSSSYGIYFDDGDTQLLDGVTIDYLKIANSLWTSVFIAGGDNIKIFSGEATAGAGDSPFYIRDTTGSEIHNFTMLSGGAAIDGANANVINLRVVNCNWDACTSDPSMAGAVGAQFINCVDAAGAIYYSGFADDTAGGTNGSLKPVSSNVVYDHAVAEASTSTRGHLVKATAPAAGLLNVVGIANGETSYTNKLLINIGSYAGANSANKAIAHGLARVPYMVLITKGASGGSPAFYGIIAGQGLINRVDAGASRTVTAPDTTNFYVGNAGSYAESANENGVTYYWTAI